MKLRLFTILVLLSTLFLTPNKTTAQSRPGLLLPIGAGYTDIYNGLGQHAVENARGDVVHILILASPYSTNAKSILQGEFNQNMKDAEERRIQTEGACQRNLPENSTLTCKVELLPIFSQEDAKKPENLAYFTDDVSMIFILGGDQETGMGAIINTPVEERINELHNMGTIIAGTSAGAAMQSKNMIASLQLSYGIADGLFAGAVKLWNSEGKRGFSFGIENAVVDQHFMQRARMGRLLNVISQPGLPHVGVGVDAYTGIVSDSEVLRDVFGLYTVTVLDAETYHSADAVKYVSIDDKHPPIISLRNIILNLLSPGEVTYDLNTRTSSLGNPPTTLKRQFEALSIPKGAGTLFLGGNLIDTLENNPVLMSFKETAGENILIVANGYSSSRSAETAIKKYTAALGGTPQSIIAGKDPITIPEGITGILVIGKDQSKANPAALAPIKELWLKGIPVMADNAAMPLFGAFYANHEPTPSDAELEELATQKSFWQGRTKIEPGLGWVNITLEPQIIDDKRFGRLFSLAYNHPNLLSIGLNSDTALRIDNTGATVIGRNGIFVFDLRKAVLKLGTNQGFVVGNAMLDVFVPGENVQPEIADMNAEYTPAATPVLPTAAPTITPTPAITATLTPLPTPTETNTPIPQATPVQTTTGNDTNPFSLWLVIGVITIITGISAFMWKKRK